MEGAWCTVQYRTYFMEGAWCTVQYRTSWKVWCAVQYRTYFMEGVWCTVQYRTYFMVCGVPYNTVLTCEQLQVCVSACMYACASCTMGGRLHVYVCGRLYACV